MCMMRKTMLLLIMGIISACGGKTESTSLQVLDFSIENVSDAINVSALTDDVSLIPLETVDSLILGQLVRVIQKDGFIYVADRQALYQFDDAGKCRKKISKQGEGPDEYLSIIDFQIDKEGNPWILSGNNRKLFRYDWNGLLRQQIPLPCGALKIHLEDDNFMYLYAGNEKDAGNSYQLKLLNLATGQFEKDYLPIDDKKSVYLHVFSNNNFSTTDSGPYFFQMFNDTVYQLSSHGELLPAYYLNLDNKNIPASFFQQEYQDIMDFFGHLHANKYAYGTSLFMKNENTTWIAYFYDKKSYWGVLNKSGCAVSTVLKEDVLLSGYPVPMAELEFYEQDNKRLFIVLWPGDILDYSKEHLTKAQQLELEKRTGPLGMEGNPLLLRLGMPAFLK